MLYGAPFVDAINYDIHPCSRRKRLRHGVCVVAHETTDETSIKSYFGGELGDMQMTFIEFEY